MIAGVAKCGPVVIRVTERQRQVISFVHNFWEQYGHGPSRVDIAAGLHMSNVSLAADHVKALLRRGFLEQRPNAARSLHLSLLGKDAIGLTTDAQERSLARCRDLLRETVALLERTMPSAPLLAEIRKELL